MIPFLSKLVCLISLSYWIFQHNQYLRLSETKEEEEEKEEEKKEEG